MNNRIYSLLLMLLFAASGYAQDVIVKKDGSTILSKVVEIGSAEVKYKKFSNQDGPMYTILKTEIQAINYENGEKESFSLQESTAPVPQQPQNFGQTNYLNDSQNYYQSLESKTFQKEKLLSSAKTIQTVGSIVFYVSLGVGVVSSIIVFDPEKDNWGTFWLVFGSCAAGGLTVAGICSAVASSKRKLASAIESASVIKHDFHLGNSCLSAGINVLNDRVNHERTLGVGVNLRF